MTCEQCGGAVELVTDHGGIKSGKFVEEYMCVECSAGGRIVGNAEDTRSWEHKGRVFNA